MDKDNNNIDNMFAATRVISVAKTFPGYGVPAMVRVAESRVIWARCYGHIPMNKRAEIYLNLPVSSRLNVTVNTLLTKTCKHHE